MLAVLYNPKHQRISTADQDSDEASSEEIEVPEQEATMPPLQAAPPDDMYEYECASSFVNMHYAYKSSIDKELYGYGNDSSVATLTTATAIACEDAV